MKLEDKPTVAMGDEVLDSLLELPRNIQRKAKETMQKFRSNPYHPGLNLEKLKTKDNRLHSIRIDQCYRMIVLKAEGNAYIMLWMDKHNEAYDWASKRHCAVNKTTGAIEVVNMEDVIASADEAPNPPAPEITQDDRPDIFSKFSQQDLEQLGASEKQLPLIRNIKTEEDIDKLERRLPRELYDALFMLAAGEGYDSVLDELGIKTDTTFEPDDFATALKLDNNKQRFHAITDDADLEAILNEPMAKWRIFLHPSQRKLVEGNFNGPARVLGGAGTGKTVVAMHRANKLAQNCGENEKILFTTFTKSLTHDIKENLKKICDFDHLRKIDVIHIDAWCSSFLNKHNYRCEIAYNNDKSSSGYQQHPRLIQLWNEACERNEDLSIDNDFLADEWDRVIQYNDISSLGEYLRIPRPGRNSRLTRLQRKAIWPVFEEFRTLLSENQLWEPADMFRAARTLLEEGQATSGYRHIVVDEAQDLHPQALRLLRAMVPAPSTNDIFLVGDAHQNLYGHHIVLSKLGIDIRGRGRRLKLNYRTPEETRQWACAVLKNIPVQDMDGELDSSKGYRSILSGPDPIIKSFASRADELEAIIDWSRATKAAHPEQIIAITAPSNKDIHEIQQRLTSQNISSHLIDSDTNDIDDPIPIRLITAFRIKGLEFDHVCISGSWVTHKNAPSDRKRHLLHVAATRTKRSLFISAMLPSEQQ